MTITELKTCFVYVITIDDLGLSKIGISDSPQKRLRQLSTSSPFKMRLAMLVAVPRRIDARQIERMFHDAFARSRVSGEWFTIRVDAACFYVGIAFGYFLKHVVGVLDEDREKAFACAGVDVKYSFALEVASEPLAITAAGNA